MNEIIPNFDPAAVAVEIAALEAEAQREFHSRSEKVAEILWDVKQHHPEHLDYICAYAKIGRSRRYELLRIGRGGKTVEKSRAETKVRVQRTRAKARAAKTESATVADSSTKAGKAKEGAGNDADATESADQQKAEYAANEETPDKQHRKFDGPRAARAQAHATARALKPKPISSSMALDEVKQFCKHWIPLLNKRDRREAMIFLGKMFDDAEANLDEYGRKRYGSARKAASEIDPSKLN